MGCFLQFFICNLSSLFWRLVLKGIKVDYPNKFMQMIDPFQLQMRTLYSFVGNIRSIIEINQKSDVLGHITVKDYSAILAWNAEAIVSKILIHTTRGLPNTGECCQARCNRILPLVCFSMHDSVSNSTLNLAMPLRISIVPFRAWLKNAEKKHLSTVQ